LPDSDNQLLLPLGPVRNSELFSNYWLTHRLELEPEWREMIPKVEQVLERLSTLWREQSSRVEKYGKEAALEQAFIQPVLEALGWKIYYQAHIQGRKPDYALFATNEAYDEALSHGHASESFWKHSSIVADAKAWHVSLDKPSRVDGRKEYPPEQIEWYLSHTGVEWGILTNGRLWRLIPRVVPTGKPRFQTFLEIDLPALLGVTATRQSRDFHGGHIREFLYFFLLFSPSAFTSQKQRATLIDRAVNGSSEYALGVSEDLKGRVFDALKLSIAGFLATPGNDLSASDDLGVCRENSFVLLYRLLFIMYAEDRGLLPYRINSTYTKNRSLGVFREDVGRTLDRRGPQGFLTDSTALWDSLSELCDLVDVGNARYGVPAYNGGLFSRDQHPFLLEKKLSDRHLAQIIDALSRTIDPLHRDAGRFRVDYRDLAIRQLGSVYEGLLEMQPCYARTELAIIKSISTATFSERFHPLSEPYPSGFRDTGERVAPHTIYLSTDKGERRSSGSYYTPDHIVDHIVSSTLRTLCKRVEDEISSEIRLAKEKLTHATQTDRSALERQLIELQGAYGERVLALKIIDPSMGSGHFLVRACQYLAEEIATSPYAAMEQELTEESTLVYWKRRVAEECLFGVDVNPLAVELAKLALWLETVANDRPLAFLDSQLRCGNSLVGARLSRLDRLPNGHGLFSGRVDKEFNQNKDDLIELLHKLREVQSRDVASIKAKERLLRQYESRANGFTFLANIWCGDFFRDEDRFTDSDYDEWIKSLNHPKQLAQLKERHADLLRESEVVNPFHWELEFPEVFFAARSGRGEGFDAVIGNPPYDVIASKEAGEDLEPLKHYFQAQPEYGPSFVGKNNLYKLFVCKAVDILRADGILSFIVPMALLGDQNALGLRKLILDSGAFTQIHAFPQKDDPHRRVFPDAKLSTVVFGMMKTTDSSVRSLQFRSTRHSGMTFEEDAPSLLIATEDIPKYDPSNMTIVSCSQADWDLAVHLMNQDLFCRLGQMCTQYQGEVNETTDKRFLSEEPGDGREVLRGASVCMYSIRDASQGVSKYIDSAAFLKGKGKDGKAWHSEETRIGFQRSAPQNNFRRIIAAPIPIGEFCFDTISYIPASGSKLPPELLLALLNSQLLEWYFRLGSSNSKLNEYQFDNLPCPVVTGESREVTRQVMERLETLIEKEDVRAIRELAAKRIVNDFPPKQSFMAFVGRLAQKICEIETQRGHVTKQNRSKLDPAAQQLQDIIDELLFAAAGFSNEEIAGIGSRMKSLA
jgi:type I restriction-modification system DNA methylase subunit